MDFYTSDTHYFHKNIIRYCQRPFTDVEEMHETMIRLWNERVAAQDTVFHLGDFGFGPAEGLRSILKRLNGHKVIVKGNHDKGLTTLKDIGFEQATLDGFHTDKSLGIPVYLRHKPNFLYHELPFFSEDEIHLCGHIHDLWARTSAYPVVATENIINVGVDQSWFTPLTLQELLNRAKENCWIGTHNDERSETDP
jgi:calcineurin-like phosphoesterase family protein